MNTSHVVLIANLGTPEAPTPKAVRDFLNPFLSDRRVVEIPAPLWWLILHGFILPFRPRNIAKGYQHLWDQYGESPLRLYTQSQKRKLQATFDSSSVKVDYCFTYGEPSLATQLDKYRDIADRVVILPMYPQYSSTTTAALYDQLSRYNLKQRDCVDAVIIKDYFRHNAYRRALAQSVRDFWAANGQGDHLLLSFHGIPKAYTDKGDPYYRQCLGTSRNLADDLALDSMFYTTCFQSRLGRAEWLKPYTSDVVRSLADMGCKTVDVICPSFSVDCLETLEEISIENLGYFTAKGGHKLRLIPCLNDSDDQIALMQELVMPFISEPFGISNAEPSCD